MGYSGASRVQRIADTVWEKVVFGSRNLSSAMTLPNVVAANFFGSWAPEEAADVFVCEASWILCGGNSESVFGGDGAHVFRDTPVEVEVVVGEPGRAERERG